MSNLWNGVIFKLDMAQFYLLEMQQDLVPAAAQGPQVHYQTHALPPFNRWAPKFYYHLDAFLVATRSVDFVITTTFGLDGAGKKDDNKEKEKKKKPKRKWIAELSPVEQKNREDFQTEYDRIATSFRHHHLTHIRNLSIHRSGMPQVEVAVLGRWGEYYRGGPTQSLPTFEQPKRLTPTGPDDPLSWMEAIRFAIEPQPEDFFVEVVSLDGNSHHPLFPSCEEYLRSANQLVKEAKLVAEQVHTQPVTFPPLFVHKSE